MIVNVGVGLTARMEEEISWPTNHEIFHQVTETTESAGEFQVFLKCQKASRAWYKGFIAIHTVRIAMMLGVTDTKGEIRYEYRSVEDKSNGVANQLTATECIMPALMP